MVASPNHPIVIVFVLKPIVLKILHFEKYHEIFRAHDLSQIVAAKQIGSFGSPQVTLRNTFLVLFKSLGTAPVASLSFLSPTVIGCFAWLNSDLGWWNQHQPSAVSDLYFNLVATDCPKQRHRCFSQPLFLVDTFPSSSSLSRGWRVPRISAHRIRSQYLARKSTMNVLGVGFQTGHLNKAIAVDE